MVTIAIFSELSGINIGPWRLRNNGSGTIFAEMDIIQNSGIILALGTARHYSAEK